MRLASLRLAVLCNLRLARLQTHDNKRELSSLSLCAANGLHFLHIPFPRPGLSLGTCRRSLRHSSEWNVFPSAVCVHTCCTSFVFLSLILCFASRLEGQNLFFFLMFKQRPISVIAERRPAGLNLHPLAMSSGSESLQALPQ